MKSCVRLCNYIYSIDYRKQREWLSWKKDHLCLLHHAMNTSPSNDNDDNGDKEGPQKLRTLHQISTTDGPSIFHNLLLIKFEPDATVCRYLFTAESLYMFRLSQHPSSGVLKTVTAASGTVHIIGTATSLWPIRPRWREVAVPILWPVPEVAVTVFSTPDDGWCDSRNI